MSGSCLIRISTLHPDFSCKKIKIRIADRAKGEPSGGTAPNRSGWTAYMTTSELYEYLRVDGKDFYTIIKI